MYSSDQLTKRILSRLGVEEAEEDTPTETPKETTPILTPFDASSKSPILDELDADVHRLDSNVIALGAKIEARGHAITHLSSQYQNLRIEHKRVERQVDSIKGIVRSHGERLDEVDAKLERLGSLRPVIRENKAEIARLEGYTDDLDVLLDDEKRQREESHSKLSGLLLLGFAFLCLLNRRTLAETQDTPRLAPPIETPAEAAARAYIAAHEFRT